MPLTITHTFHTDIPDSPEATAAGMVLPSHWNSSHTITGTLEVASITGLANVATSGSYSDLSDRPGSQLPLLSI